MNSACVLIYKRFNTNCKRFTTNVNQVVNLEFYFFILKKKIDRLIDRYIKMFAQIYVQSIIVDSTEGRRTIRF